MLDNVTINQLRAFVAVCDQGSFSGAARELNRAQSAISHAIKALERAFDVALFERNTRKATLYVRGPQPPAGCSCGDLTHRGNEDARGFDC